ncbi:NAD-dependent epimerase/dehydratase family protein [Niallia sp. Sow4_A1]|uniref:NAD-dependent epimerase/dehydratase family protein n=1 Tax=Niallia sp. Sow4_A1 TaxID=3438793 RepID=UPI003F94D281
MNVLITGCSGLVGSSLVKSFIKEDIKVIGYDRFNQNEYIENFFFEEGDLCDFPRLATIVKNHRVDTIIHCGGISHPNVGGASPNNIVQINIVGTMNVFEVARLFNLNRVIYLSSGAVYGNNNLTITKETDPLNPTTIYGVTKVTGEQLANVFSSTYGLDIVCLRLAFVYGSNRSMPDPIKTLLVKAINDNNILEEYGADQSIEYIYVNDVVEAIRRTLTTKHLEHNVFNIGSGITITIREILHIIKEMFPDILINVGPGDYGYDMIGSFDCSRAKRELGFQAEYSIEKGIQEYANYLLNNKINS